MPKKCIYDKPLYSASAKVDRDRYMLARSKGMNFSDVARKAIDAFLDMGDSELDQLKLRLNEIDSQISELMLERKILSEQIEDIQLSAIKAQQMESEKIELMNLFIENALRIFGNYTRAVRRHEPPNKTGLSYLIQYLPSVTRQELIDFVDGRKNTPTEEEIIEFYKSHTAKAEE